MNVSLNELIDLRQRISQGQWVLHETATWTEGDDERDDELVAFRQSVTNEHGVNIMTQLNPCIDQISNAKAMALLPMLIDELIDRRRTEQRRRVDERDIITTVCNMQTQMVMAFLNKDDVP